MRSDKASCDGGLRDIYGYRKKDKDKDKGQKGRTNPNKNKTGLDESIVSLSLGKGRDILSHDHRSHSTPAHLYVSELNAAGPSARRLSLSLSNLYSHPILDRLRPQPFRPRLLCWVGVSPCLTHVSVLFSSWDAHHTKPKPTIDVNLSTLVSGPSKTQSREERITSFTASKQKRLDKKSEVETGR